MSAQSIAPGARVVVRDEEWMVERVQHADSGAAVSVVGLSELVRGHRAVFLTELDEIVVLKPEETQIVADPSSGFRQSRLYLEALLRRSPPTDARLVMGHLGAVNAAPYQWEPAAKALRQLRPRILMADGVGLGKTIEVGVLLTELIQRGRGARILVVALKSILAQFQEELWARFSIPLVRLDSVGVQRVQAKIPSNQNPFHYFDRVIVSIDTLKKDARYRRHLEDCHWDVVVIDECQNVAERGHQRSQRNALARLLARNTDGLIFTSATPHDGKPESFASLMQLLEPTAIADATKYQAQDVAELFIRRFQKDVRDAHAGQFLERDVASLKVKASPAEDAVFQALAEARFRTIGRSGNTDALFRVLLLKAWLSSPAACKATLQSRKSKLLARDPSPDVSHDLDLLDELLALVDAVGLADQRKLDRLCSFLQELGYAPGVAGERVVIFSERLDTLHFLEHELARRFKLSVTTSRKGELHTWKKGQIAVFEGGLPDQEQYALVQDFSNQNGAVRLLLGSDAASEGLNLHHACHHLVHYDVPWSLITLEQRNGRIDRYGQTAAPILRYLLTEPTSPALQGDLRIIERLIAKETEAAANLGDVAWLMKLHSAEQEEARIAQAIADGEAPEQVLPDSDAGDDPEDWLQALLADAGEVTDAASAQVDVHERLSLFRDDLAFAREGFTQLGLDGSAQAVDWLEPQDGFRLRAPDDLKLRYRYLPPELRRGREGEHKLTVDRERVMRSYATARDTEDGWPEWELFWPQHPIAEWLNDRVLASFRRHEAPIIEVSEGLAPGESAFVFQSTVSNQRSQPVIVDWSVVRRGALGALELGDFSELATHCGLHQPLANTGRALGPEQLQRSLLPAVRLVRDQVDRLRVGFERDAAERLRPTVRALRRWRTDAKARLENVQESMLVKRSDQLQRLARERAEIDHIFQARTDWVNLSIRCSPTPYIRLAAVLVRPVPTGAP